MPSAARPATSRPLLAARRPRRATPATATAMALAMALATALATAMTLTGCGGGGGEGSAAATAYAARADAAPAEAAAGPNASALGVASGGTALAGGTANVGITRTQRGAVKLADAGSFGPSEALLAEINSIGPTAWVRKQMTLNTSRYTTGGSGAIHQGTVNNDFCSVPANAGPNCWRDNYSTEPLVWDFYRNALGQPDQLRQRVAFALQQIVVVSGVEVSGTYGFRNYYNALLGEAFGNYRNVLRKVALSPVMGDFLNNANNDKGAPNENFARELLQLFAIGTCELNLDGSLKGGDCKATYNNETVRSYAYALTGWTYPAGGATPWGCWPQGLNCQYYGGDMVPAEAFHDTAPRTLLSGVNLPAGHRTAAALESVLDSLMSHPNMAPFIARQLIQHLTTSNPSPAYVQRVAAAFNSGRYGTFGQGAPGDLAATVAAVLLDTDTELRSTRRMVGKLREPALMFTGVLRALNGRSDGEALSWWWGGDLRQHLFRPPSVFNYYPPDYPVAGTRLVGPAFGIHNANTTLQRLNFLTFLVDWGGAAPTSGLPGAVGTRVDLSAFASSADDAGALVDRLSGLATGNLLPAASRTAVVDAVAWWTPARDVNWRQQRVKTAAYLVFAAPEYQVIR